MYINKLFELLKNKISKSLNFYMSDEKLLIVYYKNDLYKTFLLKEIFKLSQKNNIEQFTIASYSNNILDSSYIYKDKDFYLNFFNEIKKVKKFKNEAIVLFKDIDAFISDEKVVGLSEYINDLRNEDNKKILIVITNKRQTMKSFCKYNPSFLSIDSYGCITEAACFDVIKKSPEESLKEIFDDEKLLGEINEN